MNQVKKIYCRIFQKAFHLVIPILPYRQPKKVEHLADIPSILKEKGVDRILIVTDQGIRSHGLLEPLEKALRENHIFYEIYDKTVANPTTDNVEEARELYLSKECQALIGFGGGSSMDCAKGVGARIARPGKSLGQMAGILKVIKKLPLFIAVPTTAGTGSETTLAAVITDAQTRHKYAINDFPLIPDYAVLDPQITVSLPPFITATTGMDALTHAVEAYIGNSTTRETRSYALKAVELIFGNLDKAYQNGEDLTARKNMLTASYYAGCAFTQSYVGYVHAVAHSLALYIFAEDKAAAKKVMDHCGFGGGCINDTIIHLATSELGFGGFGESGMGSYHGKSGFDTFSHYKSIVDKKTWLDLPMRYQPYRKINEKLVRFFLR